MRRGVAIINQHPNTDLSPEIQETFTLTSLGRDTVQRMADKKTYHDVEITIWAVTEKDEQLQVHRERQSSPLGRDSQYAHLEQEGYSHVIPIGDEVVALRIRERK